MNTTSVGPLVRWYRGRGPWVKSVANGTTAFAVLYFGAIVENQVEILSEDSLWPTSIYHAVAILAVVVLVTMVSYSVRAYSMAIEKEELQRKETLSYAASLSEQFAIQVADETVTTLQAEIENNRALGTLVTNPARISAIVDNVYRLFEATYGESDKLENRVDFEATFIAKSYLDGGLTIPAYANRNRRAPRSMRHREGNPKHFDETVAAQLYRETNTTPRLQIISATDDPEYKYVELYPGQKERVKSSLVHPVLSPQNELVGVLVVHCNRARFFREEDRRYWTELLELFATRLALEKVKLDALCQSEVADALKTDPLRPF